ncbi:DUF1461 domain-containing protein [Comamonas endophytica]|uniref:DUF1461 domain-containing protein n=1 Tax=Comamonas endophytica TaxID=2949090 RepID=A0ABY6G9C7_9BURK|nr:MULTISPECIES: DUF1461 domain-containing protein [unclassified Acidovorax]MCD2514035.1 DUF1461 domain-containing protein [Acidovorax sp. D4N7]UYG51182.1 DUF1461 domain-containing protein [Acidovorax sp. 5MLIR]
MKRLLFWTLFYVCQMLALALLAWHLLAQWSFAYPIGYRWVGIGETIARYAPLNRYRADFEFTSAQEHWRLFGEITAAVQSGGKGLEQISYLLPDGQPQALMHAAEIMHLEDVADLIDGFYRVGIAAFLAWLVLLAVVYRRRLRLPAPRTTVQGWLAGVGLLTTMVLLAGPEKLFYWLHTQVFPAGHQWYFHYQDSLMTTLMKAPDIFAFIAVLLVLLWAALWCMASYGLQRLLRWTRARAASAASASIAGEALNLTR